MWAFPGVLPAGSQLQTADRIRSCPRPDKRGSLGTELRKLKFVNVKNQNVVYEEAWKMNDHLVTLQASV